MILTPFSGYARSAAADADMVVDASNPPAVLIILQVVMVSICERLLFTIIKEDIPCLALTYSLQKKKINDPSIK